MLTNPVPVVVPSTAQPSTAQQVLQDVQRRFRDMGFGGVEKCRTLKDVSRSVLLLLGGTGQGTPVHCDRTEAFNVAFALAEYLKDGPLARWVFFEPRAASLVLEYMNKHHVRSNDRMLLDECAIEQLGKHLEAELGSKAMHIVDQYSGEIIHVQTGFLHQVCNLQPCVKLAFDYVDTSEVCAYAWLHREVIAKMTGAYGPPTDYMAVLHTIVQAIACEGAEKKGF